jgi:hypothetical protein
MIAAGRPLPFVFRVDVEPDLRLVDRFRPVPWSGFERGVRALQSLRERARAATGSPARFTWLARMDPQVGDTYGNLEWAAEHYSSNFEDIAAQGDAIGLHVHTQRWTQQQRWCSDYRQDWVDYCVRASFDAYRRAFGRDCEVHAFGDRWLNDATVRLLESLGVRFDLTVEPDQPRVARSRFGGLSTEDTPANTGAPRHPYRPSSSNFCAHDPARQDGMWMLPLTTAQLPRDPLRRLYDRLRRRPPAAAGHSTLNPSLPPASFRAVLESALLRPETCFLAMVARTEVFLGRLGDNVDANLEWLLQHPDIGRFAFSTPAEVLETLRLDGRATKAA